MDKDRQCYGVKGYDQDDEGPHFADWAMVVATVIFSLFFWALW